MFRGISDYYMFGVILHFYGEVCYVWDPNGKDLIRIIMVVCIISISREYIKSLLTIKYGLTLLSFIVCILAGFFVPIYISCGFIAFSEIILAWFEKFSMYYENNKVSNYNYYLASFIGFLKLAIMYVFPKYYIYSMSVVSSMILLIALVRFASFMK